MKRHWPGLLLAAALLAASASLLAKPAAASAAAEAYVRARTAYETEASAYWQQVADKRRARFAKRRSNEPVGLDDYMLTQPPLYAGPPRPAGLPPKREPGPPPQRIPVIADFLKARPSNTASCRTARPRPSSSRPMPRLLRPSA
jgi:hypothetical protein